MKYNVIIQNNDVIDQNNNACIMKKTGGRNPMSQINEDGSEIFHYDDPEFPVFCRNNFIPAGLDLHRYTPAHWHSELEFIYIYEGKIHHTINDKYITLHQGEGLFINSKQFHELITDKQEHCRLYCLIFHPDLLKNCLLMERIIHSVSECDSLEYILLREQEDWQQEVLQEIKQICEMNQFADPEKYGIDMMMKVFRIVKLIRDNMNLVQQKDHGNSGEKKTLKDMMRYIQWNYKNPLSLEDICKAGSIGKTKCISLFKNYMHMTPSHYIRYFRIDRSLYLLRETESTVAQIASEVGFDSSSYFCEIFKKDLGITPLAYRKQAKEERQ